MKFKDMNRIIRRNLKKNRSRTFMTAFAAAIGCSFLIVVASLGYGVQKGIVENITAERLLNQISIYSKTVTVGGDLLHRALNAEDMAELERLNGVKAVTRTLWLGQSPAVSFGSYRGTAQVLAVHMPAEEASGRELYLGRMPEAPHEVLVGYHFNTILKESGNIEDEQAASPMLQELLGREIEVAFRQYFDEEEAVQTYPLKIAGILKAPSREWESDQKIYLSMDMLAQIEQFTLTRGGHVLEPGTPDEVRELLSTNSLEPRPFDQVYLYTHQVQDVKEVSEKLQESGYSVYSVLNEIDEMNFYFLIFQAGLILVGTIAVLIASIGIYNTMTMAVNERSQEIGIMKAVGSHPKVIKRLFLLESAYIGTAGALAGILIAYVVSCGVNLGLPLLFDLTLNETVPEWFRFSHIPAGLVAVSALICIGTAAFSGLRPAARATRFDVLRALRRDL